MQCTVFEARKRIKDRFSGHEEKFRKFCSLCAGV
jgi:hypothetical protein